MGAVPRSAKSSDLCLAPVASSALSSAEGSSVAEPDPDGSGSETAGCEASEDERTTRTKLPDDEDRCSGLAERVRCKRWTEPGASEQLVLGSGL